MVRPFQFARVPKIIFRNGAVSELPSLVSYYGKNIALVSGKTSFIQNKNSQDLFNSFRENGITYHSVIVAGEPSPEIIDEAVRDFSDKNIDVVVGIGGGSALDAGKAISAMLGKKESVFEYLEGVGHLEHPGTRSPFIAIPTTSGTGSEATKNAVISRVGKTGFKASLRQDNLVPDVALIDPELTTGCPPDVTAASGMDCFTQLTEAYLSSKAIDYTDAIAYEGLKAVKDSLLACYKDGTNLAARAGMSFAALSSGICLANAGLGVVHGFASSLGGTYFIPHGVVCGKLMASANKVNVRLLEKTPDNITLFKYASLGKLFLDEKGKSDSFYIDGFIDYLFYMSEELHLPGLKQFGVEEKDLTDICRVTDNKNNPVKLGIDDLLKIVTSCM